MLGSDAIALAPFTSTISYLEDGDFVVLKRGGAQVYDASGVEVKRPILRSGATSFLVEKGNFRHFMAKEIHEQPEVVAHTLGAYIDFATERVTPPELPFDFGKLDRITISACGTAYYAGLIGKYWFERFARLPVEVDIASELRYREAPFTPGNLAIFVSQSGETADTLATLRHAKAHGQHVLSIVNVATSTIARESDLVMPTLAGPEIGVASTKAFTCQLAVLACLAIAAGRVRGTLTEEDERNLVRALIEVPRHMTEALALEPQIERLARDIAKNRDVLYLGRGTSYPLALEGALKLKEISYIHAEGYAGGELKHGPIALIDATIPVIVIAPYDRVFEKTVSDVPPAGQGHVGGAGAGAYRPRGGRAHRRVPFGESAQALLGGGGGCSRGGDGADRAAAEQALRRHRRADGGGRGGAAGGHRLPGGRARRPPCRVAGAGTADRAHAPASRALRPDRHADPGRRQVWRRGGVPRGRGHRRAAAPARADDPFSPPGRRRGHRDRAAAAAHARDLALLRLLREPGGRRGGALGQAGREAEPVTAPPAGDRPAERGVKALGATIGWTEISFRPVGCTSIAADASSPLRI